MKITDKRRGWPLYYCDIAAGEVFEFEGTAYIKSDSNWAVSLEKGRKLLMKKESTLELLHCEVIVHD